MIMKKSLSLAISLLATSSIVDAATFVMEKNEQSFSIDGNNGAQEGQQLYLWDTNASNVNQNWVQLSRDDGYYSYKKQGTNLCWDGGDDGAYRQPVTLEVCDEDNYDQHWSKVKTFSGTEIYRFEKRNAPGWSIDGAGGAERRQSLYLWSSDDGNVNQQWSLTRTDEDAPSDDSSSDDSTSADALYLQHVDSGSYYGTNASGELVLTSSAIAKAQGLEKVTNGDGFYLKAVGGDFDGLYAYEADGSDRQELTSDESSAEIFYEYDCGDDVVYFVSGATGKSLKNESDDKLSNSSGGECDDEPNEFTWVGSDTDGGTDDGGTDDGGTDDGGTDDGIEIPAGDAEYPSDLMRNADQWKITYPNGDEVKGLSGETNEYFYVNDEGNGIVFYAPVRSDNGTTPNSSYIRSELREREADNSADIYWTTSGKHVVYAKQAITHLPIVKPHLVATQIHGDKEAGIDDSLVLRLEDSHLFLSFNGEQLRDDVTIKTDYELGAIHEVIFEVIDDKHYVYYSEDGNLASAYASGNADEYLVKDGSNDYLMDLSYGDSYFKIGNYTQSNAEKEGDYTDHPDNYGEVVVYDFWVLHE